MTEKLKDYQVLDVLCDGSFYKVKHKVTNKIYAWKAYNCSTFSSEQIQHVIEDVKIVSKVELDCLLRYYDTIFHARSKTLYLVMEYCPWSNVEQRASQYGFERLVWRLLHSLALLCQALALLPLRALAVSLSSASMFVDDRGQLRVHCLEPYPAQKAPVQQVAILLKSLGADKYSLELRDVLAFLQDRSDVRPEVVLYHPTVLTNLDCSDESNNVTDLALPFIEIIYSDINKCDSEKAVELSKVVTPAPRTSNIIDSPIYSNVCPKKAIMPCEDVTVNRSPSLSPTIAALALELPGFVPRSRKPLADALDSYKSPQRVSEKTLSQQWMSRLVALRQREESLNKREREIISKEIVNSPAAKVISFNDSMTLDNKGNSNGITLPPMISATSNKEDTRNNWVSRRHNRRSSSVRTRSKARKSYAYEDLDSSLSADAGDSSMIVTATKITRENMPKRNIFPEVSTKKVHFTSVNPFAESDESVTLTFYELENVDNDGYQVPKKQEVLKDITKFKYLDLEKVTAEKRASMQQWNQSSPSKQAKVTKKIFADITNANEVKRTPSKTSLMSKSSNISNNSSQSIISKSSVESGKSKSSDAGVWERTRASLRQSCAFTPGPEGKKVKSRKSLLPFKTPFKFMSKG